MKAYCKAQIEQRGVDNVTVDWLISQITPHGKGMCTQPK